MHDKTAQVATVSVQEGPDPEVFDLLRRAAEYAAGLYPPESRHLLPLQQLEAPNAILLVARAWPATRLGVSR